jgi:prepilin-type N-terminal cleavage/methylation domain-containing protein
MKHRKQAANQAGFTLLEAMVAITIMGAAVAAISGVLSTSMRNVGRAEEYERVALLARSQMNELMTLPWKDRTIWAGKWSEGYTWRAETASVPVPKEQESGYELMRLTLVATWQTSRGAKTLTLETARLQMRTQ